jgi:hypothetical protein
MQGKAKSRQCKGKARLKARQGKTKGTRQSKEQDKRQGNAKNQGT